MAGFILSGNAHKRSFGAECGDVERDIGGAAQTGVGAQYSHNGNRRFGRNALCVANPILIEHAVADHENAFVGKNG